MAKGRRVVGKPWRQTANGRSVGPALRYAKLPQFARIGCIASTFYLLHGYLCVTIMSANGPEAQHRQESADAMPAA
jgi:hypothetical protein